MCLALVEYKGLGRYTLFFVFLIPDQLKAYILVEKFSRLPFFNVQIACRCPLVQTVPLSFLYGHNLIVSTRLSLPFLAASIQASATTTSAQR
jgi:hypothetical protein